MMRKFRKKPIVVEAERWEKLVDNPSFTVVKLDWLGGAPLCALCGEPIRSHGLVLTGDGPVVACPGDVVVRFPGGDTYVFDEVSFHFNYQRVDADTDGEVAK